MQHLGIRSSGKLGEFPSQRSHTGSLRSTRRVPIIGLPTRSRRLSAEGCCRNGRQRGPLVSQTGLVALDNVNDPALSDTDRVSLWLMSNDGKAVLRRTLRDLRLPTAFDGDLIMQVCHAADQMTAKGEPIESIPAWTTRTLRLRGIDLVRWPRSSRASTVVTTSDGELDVELPHTANARRVDPHERKIAVTDCPRTPGPSGGL